VDVDVSMIGEEDGRLVHVDVDIGNKQLIMTFNGSNMLVDHGHKELGSKSSLRGKLGDICVRNEELGSNSSLGVYLGDICV
jgi:hypothetical protein